MSTKQGMKVSAPSIAPIGLPAPPLPGVVPAQPTIPRASDAPAVAEPAPAHEPAESGTQTVAWFRQSPRQLHAWNRAEPPRPVEGNLVQALIDVRDYYAAAGATIRAARANQGDSIYIAGWTVDLDTPMFGMGSQTLGSLLKDAILRGVAVRLLLDSSYKNAARSVGVAARIEAMGGGAVVDYFRHAAGSQHQKFLVGRTAEGVVAYCGTADFENCRLGRYGNGGLLVSDAGYTPQNAPLASNPWHEVVVRIQGPAAIDIWQTFIQRYQSACRVEKDPYKSHIYGPISLIEPIPSLAAGTAGRVMAQVVRTFPNPAAKSRVDLSTLRTIKPGMLADPIHAMAYELLVKGLETRMYMPPYVDHGYPDFAAKGETGYYLALRHAIGQTKEYIYLEDQYLVDSVSTPLHPAITGELRRTLEKETFKKMVILIAGTPTVQGELYQAASRRRAFYEQLGSKAPGKVSVFWNAYNKNSPYWMHSKTWVFDDACAVVGSANCNRRSYACDSELGLVLVDRDSDKMSMVKRMRMDLCLKHLNNFSDASPMRGRLKTDKDVFDFMKAAAALDEAAAAATSNGTLSVAPIGTDMTADVMSEEVHKAFILAVATSVQIGVPLVLAIAGKSVSTATAAANFNLLTRDLQWEVIDPEAQ